MDEDNTITPLESATIRNALKMIALNVLTLITMATGKVFDIEAIQNLLDQGATLGINAVSVYYGCKAIRARINATEIIKKKE